MNNKPKIIQKIIKCLREYQQNKKANLLQILAKDVNLKIKQVNKELLSLIEPKGKLVVNCKSGCLDGVFEQLQCFFNSNYPGGLIANYEATISFKESLHEAKCIENLVKLCNVLLQFDEVKSYSSTKFPKKEIKKHIKNFERQIEKFNNKLKQLRQKKKPNKIPQEKSETPSYKSLLARKKLGKEYNTRPKNRKIKINYPSRIIHAKPLDLLKSIIFEKGEQLKEVAYLNQQLDKIINLGGLKKFFNTGTPSFTIGNTLLGTINNFFDSCYYNITEEKINLLIRIVKFTKDKKHKSKSKKWLSKNTEGLYNKLTVYREINFKFSKQDKLQNFPKKFVKILKLFLDNCNKDTISIFISKAGDEFLTKIKHYIDQKKSINKNTKNRLPFKKNASNFTHEYQTLIQLIQEKLLEIFPLNEMLAKETFTEVEYIFKKWLGIYGQTLPIFAHEEYKEFHKKITNKLNFVINYLIRVENSQQNLLHIINNKGKFRCNNINFPTAISGIYIDGSNIVLHQNFIIGCIQLNLTEKELQNILEIYESNQVKIEKQSRVKNKAKKQDKGIDIFKGLCNSFATSYLSKLLERYENYSTLLNLVNAKKAIMNLTVTKDGQEILVKILPIKEIWQQISAYLSRIYSTFPNRITRPFTLEKAKLKLSNWRSSSHRLVIMLTSLLVDLKEINKNKNIPTYKICKDEDVEKFIPKIILKKLQFYAENIYEHLTMHEIVKSINRFYIKYNKFLSDYANLGLADSNTLLESAHKLDNIIRKSSEHSIFQHNFNLENLKQIMNKLSLPNKTFKLTCKVVKNKKAAINNLIIYVIMPSTSEKNNKQNRKNTTKTHDYKFKFIINNTTYIISHEKTTKSNENNCVMVDVTNIQLIKVDMKCYQEKLKQIDLPNTFPNKAKQALIAFLNYIENKVKRLLTEIKNIEMQVGAISLGEKRNILQQIFANQGVIFKYGEEPIYISYFKSKEINVATHKRYSELLKMFFKFGEWGLKDYQNVATFFNQCKLLYSDFTKSNLYKNLQKFSQSYIEFLLKKECYVELYKLSCLSSIFSFKIQNSNDYFYLFQKTEIIDLLLKDKDKILQGLKCEIEDSTRNDDEPRYNYVKPELDEVIKKFNSWLKSKLVKLLLNYRAFRKELEQLLERYLQNNVWKNIYNSQQTCNIETKQLFLEKILQGDPIFTINYIEKQKPRVIKVYFKPFSSRLITESNLQDYAHFVALYLSYISHHDINSQNNQGNPVKCLEELYDNLIDFLIKKVKFSISIFILRVSRLNKILVKFAKSYIYFLLDNNKLNALVNLHKQGGFLQIEFCNNNCQSDNKKSHVFDQKFIFTCIEDELNLSQKLKEEINFAKKRKDDLKTKPKKDIYAKLDDKYNLSFVIEKIIKLYQQWNKNPVIADILLKNNGINVQCNKILQEHAEKIWEITKNNISKWCCDKKYHSRQKGEDFDISVELQNITEILDPKCLNKLNSNHPIRKYFSHEKISKVNLSFYESLLCCLSSFKDEGDSLLKQDHYKRIITFFAAKSYSKKDLKIDGINKLKKQVAKFLYALISERIFVLKNGGVSGIVQYFDESYNRKKEYTPQEIIFSLLKYALYTGEIEVKQSLVDYLRKKSVNDKNEKNTQCVGVLIKLANEYLISVFNYSILLASNQNNSNNNIVKITEKNFDKLAIFRLSNCYEFLQYCKQDKIIQIIKARVVFFYNMYVCYLAEKFVYKNSQLNTNLHKYVVKILFTFNQNKPKTWPSGTDICERLYELHNGVFANTSNKFNITDYSSDNEEEKKNVQDCLLRFYAAIKPDAPVIFATYLYLQALQAKAEMEKKLKKSTEDKKSRENLHEKTDSDEQAIKQAMEDINCYNYALELIDLFMRKDYMRCIDSKTEKFIELIKKYAKEVGISVKKQTIEKPKNIRNPFVQQVNYNFLRFKNIYLKPNPIQGNKLLVDEIREIQQIFLPKYKKLYLEKVLSLDWQLHEEMLSRYDALLKLAHSLYSFLQPAKNTKNQDLLSFKSQDAIIALPMPLPQQIAELLRLVVNKLSRMSIMLKVNQFSLKKPTKQKKNIKQLEGKDGKLDYDDGINDDKQYSVEKFAKNLPPFNNCMNLYSFLRKAIKELSTNIDGYFEQNSSPSIKLQAKSGVVAGILKLVPQLKYCKGKLTSKLEKELQNSKQITIIQVKNSKKSESNNKQKFLVVDTSFGKLEKYLIVAKDITLQNNKMFKGVYKFKILPQKIVVNKNLLDKYKFASKQKNQQILQKVATMYLNYYELQKQQIVYRLLIENYQKILAALFQRCGKIMKRREKEQEEQRNQEQQENKKSHKIPSDLANKRGFFSKLFGGSPKKKTKTLPVTTKQNKKIKKRGSIGGNISSGEIHKNPGLIKINMNKNPIWAFYCAYNNEYNKRKNKKSLPNNPEKGQKYQSKSFIFKHGMS
jgi:hypothetical protein